jgi:PAS domain S-box-containing protein
LAFENITQRKQVEEALRDALQKLNFHFENTPLAVIERDRDFRVTRWSKAAERIFGWQAEEVIGQDWQGIFVEDVEAIQNSRARILSGEEKQNICYNRTYTKNGSVVDCEWYNSALFDEAGNFVSVLSLVLDVTDRKQAEAERDRLLKLEQAARSAAESANRLKDEFLAVLSHELRSPLNPILGWVKLLRSRKMDESTQTRALETIERNATLQARLIEDLLDVSRIMRGKTSLNISSVNLASTIEGSDRYGTSICSSEIN